MKRKPNIVLCLPIAFILMFSLTACKSSPEEISSIIWLETEIISSPAEPVESKTEAVASKQETQPQPKKEEVKTKITEETKEKELQPLEPEPEKTFVLQGKAITLRYVEKVQPKNPNYHAWYVYENDNNIDLHFDVYTGQVVSVFNIEHLNNPNQDGKEITEEEAIKISEDFVTENGYDLKRYTRTRCEFKQSPGGHYSEGIYTINYSRFYEGYRTADWLMFEITKSGIIRNFHGHPFDFKNVKMVSVDKVFLTEQLNKALEEIKSKKTPDSTAEYIVNSDGSIGVNEANELILSCSICYSYDCRSCPPEAGCRREEIYSVYVKLDKTLQAPFYKIDESVAMTNYTQKS